MTADLLNYIYRDSKDIYLKQLESTSSYSARATFIFGHNPRTADYTHVGAAEMLAGISQAAYALTHRYQPELIKDENIAGCFFKDISIKFSKMLAPNAAADLNLEFVPGKNGSLPTFHFDGFVSGRVSCGLGAQSQRKTKSVASLTKSTSEVLKSFYNNGSDLTLKDISRTGHDRWQTVSSFKPDARLKLCNYTTTTQIIVGLSQLAFAVAGDTLESQQANLYWSRGDFLNSMSDQALVNLNYTRASVLHHELNLATDLAAVKNVRGCKFIRLKINGDLNGTMDNMLSPRVPVKSIRVNGTSPEIS